MKKYLIFGVTALALASCSHDADWGNLGNPDQLILEKYNQAFIDNIGVPAPSQDWGFGASAATRGVTRAAFTDKWTNDHNCNWESKLTFTLPAGAVDVTQPNFDKSGSVYYIPEGTTGEVSLGWLGLNAGAELYNYGNITAINDVNYNGTITFYNAGTMTNFGPSSGGRHTVVNIGSLTVCGYANIGDLYNGGALVLERDHNPYWPNEGGSADIPNAMNIYSNGAATIEMPDGGDLKAVCDIHGTLKVGDGKNLKIQNSTTKYICGIESTAKVENVDGPLQTSYVKADLFTFDGNPIYLLPGGHVDVTTLQIINSNCQVYGHTGSVALIEATNVEFGNKNDFTHTFSDNIYFKVSGSVKVDNCYAMGQSHSFNNVADYLADTTHADEFALAADRVNAGNATGAPACGNAWTVGTPGNTGDDDDDDDNGDDNDDEFTFMARIFAEDLSATSGSDFDFNDVVFDVYTNDKGQAKVIILAAGGTLPLTVAEEEVHALFGQNADVMINTNADKADLAAGWKSVNGLEPVELPKLIEGIYSMEDLDKIEIWVQKKNISDELKWYLLTAKEGEPASKFAVTKQIKWCNERVDIKEVYTEFVNWVTNEPDAKWYETIADGAEVNLYDDGKTE